MKESPFGFSYSWQDLKPVRPLFVTVLVAQVIGASIGIKISFHPGWFDNLWSGAALATFPGIAAGLGIQSLLQPAEISQNIVMVKRMGAIALVFSVLAFLFPHGGFRGAL